MNRFYKIVALFAACVLGFAGFINPVAAQNEGGGSIGGGGGSGGSNDGWYLVVGDDLTRMDKPFQGTMKNSTKFFADAVASLINAARNTPGRGWSTDGYKGIETAANEALAEAQQRARDRFNAGEYTKAQLDQALLNTRVVTMMISYHQSCSGSDGSVPPCYDAWTNWNMNIGGWNDAFKAQWPAASNNLAGYDNLQKDAVRARFQAELDDKKAIADGLRVVVVALNGMEPQPPAPPEFDTSVTTKASTTGFEVDTTTTVKDTITVKTTPTQTGTVDAKVTLNWGGNNPRSTTVNKSVTKNVKLKLNGATDSPSFSHSDFGFDSWAAGKYWYDVEIAKQGDMKAAVSIKGVSDAQEQFQVRNRKPTKSVFHKDTNTTADSWTIFPGDYTTTKISVNNNGYQKFVVTDKIETKNVFIGAKNKDDLSAVKVFYNGSNANTNAAVTQLSDSLLQKRIVETTNGRNVEVTISDSVLRAGYYTVQIPTYMKENTTGNRLSVVDSACARTGYMQQDTSRDELCSGNKVTYIPPVDTPEKGWALTKGGAIEIANAIDSGNGKMFYKGDPISAVVKTDIPAYVRSFDSFAITDEWGTASLFVDFSDASKVKVLFNGADVTQYFDIRVDTRLEGKEYTRAIAKPEFLKMITMLNTPGTVQLVLSGTVIDTDTGATNVQNKGNVDWGNTVMDVNNPPESIFTPPSADKVWTINESGSLEANDPDHTNQVAADQKKFVPGDNISAVVNTMIPSGSLLAYPPNKIEIVDDWTNAAPYLDFTEAKVFMKPNQGTTFADVTSQFTIKTENGVTTATAKKEFLDYVAKTEDITVLKLAVNGKFKLDTDTNGQVVEMINAGSVQINSDLQITNEPPVFIETPKPNKVWVLDENGALSANDANWSNTVAADGKTFIAGEAVSAVVNGKIPSNLATNLTEYKLVDDWSNASEYVDFTDASKVKVYADGIDVTTDFTITVQGTVTTAVAKNNFLLTTGGLAQDKIMKLVLNGKFYDDANTEGELVELHNNGAEKWNLREEPTNVPAVFVWTPDPDKDVIASATQGGDQSSINGKKVFPGQIIEYQVNLDLRIPDNLAYEIEKFGVEDQYDPNFVPNKTSLEFYDARDNKVIPRTNWKVNWDDENNKFTVLFNEDWVKENAGSLTEEGWLIMRFDGRVRDTAPMGDVLENKAFELLNNSRTPTPEPIVEIPEYDPNKEVLDTFGNNIDGMTLLVGDKISYRLTLDAKIEASEYGYKVHRLGLIDNYDSEYLELKTEDIQVLNKNTGEDVTDKFNLQIIDGVAYIFAKQVDSVNVNGEDVPGDPQPENLAEYAEMEIDPINTPIIDQDLLGNEYWVMLNTTVIKENEDGDHEVKNQAIQVLENMRKETVIVSNLIKDIDPEKDVVVEVKGDSIDGSEVPLNSLFNYKLKSSVRPSNLVYDTVDWRISDTFDPYYDLFTGKWAVYAESDIYRDGTLIYNAGDLLADSEGTNVTENKPALFEASFEDNTFSIHAAQPYLDMINGNKDLEHSWAVYTQMERVAPGEEIPNVFDEYYNTIPRESNKVVTSTPEILGIDLEKFDTAFTEKDGDRDFASEALKLDVDPAKRQVEITFRITNTSNVTLKDITLTDETVEGYGVVENLVYPEDWDGYLQVGESIDIIGTFSGLEDGQFHKNHAVVTGKSVFTDTEVSDDDPWHAVAPSTPHITVEKYDVASELEAGDRDTASDALQIKPNEEVEIGFIVTNSGTENLKDVVLTDTTIDGQGVVEDITTPEGWDGNLAVGESVEFRGMLRGVTSGLHSNMAEVVGYGVNSGIEVTDDDPWYANPVENPSIKLEKFDTVSGLEAGDRDVYGDALEVTGDTEISFQITNDGDVDLTEVELTDETVDGTGVVNDITAPEGWDGNLAVGESVVFTGVLTGVEANTHHENLAKVVGKSVQTGEEVSDEDPWFGKISPVEEPPAEEPETPVKDTLAREKLSDSGITLLPLVAAAVSLGAGAMILKGRRKK